MYRGLLAFLLFAAWTVAVIWVAFDAGLARGEKQAVRDIFGNLEEPRPILTEHGAFLILPPRTAGAFGVPQEGSP